MQPKNCISLLKKKECQKVTNKLTKKDNRVIILLLDIRGLFNGLYGKIQKMA